MTLIAVDMTPVLPGGRNGGAKVLALELLKSFQKSASEHRFLIITANWNHEELGSLDGPNMSRLCLLRGQEPVPKTTAAKYPGLIRRGVGKIRRRLMGVVGAGAFSSRPLTSRGVALLFCPFTAPTYSEPGIRTVSTILDLQHRDLPHFFSPHELGLRDAFMAEVISKSDRIICISEYVRQRAIHELGVDPEKTHAVHISIQARLSNAGESAAGNRDSGLQGLPRSYMFYPANFWPHKNHAMLLTAYGMFLSRHPQSKLNIVFTGALEERERDLRESAVRMGLRDRVHFLGYLAERDLRVVWEGCDFLIFPSLYEGFGIPVLEAMSLGKPVVCSHLTSLPEVAGEAALYFDPRKPADIVACMEKMAGDVSLRKDMVARGFSRVKDFRLEDMTQKYLDVFGEALEAPMPCLSDGATGLFEDGWLGDEVTVTCGPGRSGRTLELLLEAPSWMPFRRIKIRASCTGAGSRRFSISRGKQKSLSFSLPEQGGRVSCSFRPAYRPADHGITEDGRALSVLCRGCWVVTPDEGRVSLV
jgi:glycosyltransferase involved in cell wall biosynthesis